MTEHQVQRLLDRIDRLERVVRTQHEALVSLTLDDPVGAKRRLASLAVVMFELRGSRETRETTR